MTEVNFQGNYYDLRGTLAQVEQILNTPYRIAINLSFGLMWLQLRGLSPDLLPFASR